MSICNTSSYQNRRIGVTELTKTKGVGKIDLLIEEPVYKAKSFPYYKIELTSNMVACPIL